MATEQLRIQVTSSGTARVARSLRNVTGEARKTTNSIQRLSGALRAVAGFVVAEQFVRLSDAFTNTNNRIKLFTNSSQEATETFERLQAISISSRTSLETNADLFGRLRLAQDGLGISLQQTLDITEALNLATKISGATTAEADGAIRQLSQGYARGELRGQELNSVLEQTPLVARLIAKELGTTAGALKLFGEEGKITDEIIRDALLNNLDDLRDKFEEVVPTITDSFTALRNSLIQAVGEFNKGTGIAGLLSDIMLFLARNIEFVQNVLRGLVTVLVILGSKRVIGLVVKGMQQLRVAVLALSTAIKLNPLGLIVTALVTLGALLIGFGDKIKIANDGVGKLTDLAAVLGQRFATFFKLFSGGIADVLRDIGVLGNGTTLEFESLLFFGLKVVDVFLGIFRRAFAEVKFFVTRVANTIDELTDRLSGTEGAREELARLKAESASLGPVRGAVFDITGGDSRIRELEKEVAVLDKLAEVNGLGAERTASAAERNVEAFKELEEARKNAFSSNEQIQAEVDALKELANKRREAIEAGQKAREEQEAAARRSAEAKKAFESQTKVLEDLRGSYGGAQEKIREYNKQQKQLNVLLLRGRVGPDEYAQILTRLTEEYRDAIDPMGAFVRKQHEITAAFGQSKEDALAAKIAEERRAAAIESGVSLTPEFIRLNDLLARSYAKERLAAEASANATKKREDAARSLADFFAGKENELATAGLSDADSRIFNARSKASDFAREANSNLGPEAMAKAVAAAADKAEEFERNIIGLENSSARAAEAIKQNFQELKQVFNILGKALEDIFTDFFTGTETDFQQLLQNLAQQLARFLAQQLVSQIGQGIAQAGGAAGGGVPGFQYGGSFMVGGQGGPDSQLVAFRATPGEQIVAIPPNKMAGAGMAPTGGQPATVNVVNITDPSEMITAIGSKEGEQAVVNVITNNRRKLQRMLSRG